MWTLPVVGMALAGALAMHTATLGAYFFEDDVQWLLSGLTAPLSRLVSLTGRQHFYRPVIELYFAVQTHSWGASPFAFHLTNVLLHALNGALVFLLASRIFRRPVPAFVASSLFVLHPRAVEMVAWISGVTGVLMTTFVLLTLILWVRFLDTRRRVWQAFSVLTCAVALLAHEAAVVLAALLPLLALHLQPPGAASEPAGRRPLARTARDLLPYALLVLAFGWLSHEVNQRNYVVVEGHYRLGWHAVTNMAHYAVSLYVGRPQTLVLWLTALALAAAAMMGTGALRFGAFWILVSLAPYSLFLWANTNRYLYLPAIGFCLVVADLLRRLAAQRFLTRRSGVTVAAVLFLFVGWRGAYYGRKTARDAAERSEPYREYVTRCRAAHPRLGRGAVVQMPSPGPDGPQPRFVEPLLRVAYGDPDLEVRLKDDSPPHSR